MIRKIISLVLAMLLLAGMGYQLKDGVQYLSTRYQNKFLASRRLDGFTRSADASYGATFAATINSLRSQIPDQATVLLPPSGGTEGPLNDQNMMQYLLFPRRIETCWTDCAVDLAQASTYVLVEGKFPPPAQVGASKHLVLCAGVPCFYAPGR